MVVNPQQAREMSDLKDETRTGGREPAGQRVATPWLCRSQPSRTARSLSLPPASCAAKQLCLHSTIPSPSVII
ncbi:hypothetical protein Hamer_G025023 [Homarus americanus]|uniref:Uncharacterized protein n=1 Tax=Homarus americanus TaxID=6706 RepID=A0A8J5K2Q2_HOMAM|nr:hypothetical protein Hamer_G025023 [Homarus americanus]